MNELKRQTNCKCDSDVYSDLELVAREPLRRQRIDSPNAAKRRAHDRPYTSVRFAMKLNINARSRTTA